VSFSYSGEPSPGDALTAEQSRISYELARVRRHWEWGRADGFGRLVEEDDLNPVRKASLAYGKWRWRRSHPAVPGSAEPIYLLGVQRSGTNMLVRGLEAAPEVEVRNENDRDTFSRFRLRVDRVVPVVSSSRHRYVLFKPLCDAHRALFLLDELPTTRPGRVIWAYRDADGRARSAVAKFGDTNLQLLRELAAGRGQDRWEAQGLSEHSRDLIGRFDWEAKSPHEAAAMFWLIRNALYFEQGLDGRDDVALASYEAFVDDPERAMESLCGFLDFPYSPELVAHIDRRSRARRPPLELDPGIRRLCDEMRERLDASLQTKSGGRTQT
jgi:hypothetical protein